MTGILLDAQREAPPEPELPPPDLDLATTVRSFAVAVLARTLEVLDGRRPRTQLAGAVADPVLAQITALLQHGIVGGNADCARLHRVHVQLRSPAAAEFFGTFVRGARARALAGSLERREVRVSPPGVLPRKTRERWVVAEFTIL